MKDPWLKDKRTSAILCSFIKGHKMDSGCRHLKHFQKQYHFGSLPWSTLYLVFNVPFIGKVSFGNWTIIISQKWFVTFVHWRPFIFILFTEDLCLWCPHYSHYTVDGSLESCFYCKGITHSGTCSYRKIIDILKQIVQLVKLEHIKFSICYTFLWGGKLIRHLRLLP